MSEAQPALLQGAVAAHPAACLPLLWPGLLDRVHSNGSGCFLSGKQLPLLCVCYGFIECVLMLCLYTQVFWQALLPADQNHIVMCLTNTDAGRGREMV